MKKRMNTVKMASGAYGTTPNRLSLYRAPKRGREKGVEILFEKIMAENFPNLGKKTSIQIQDPSKWTGWISLQSKGLSRVFSNTAVQKHQFFSTQPSSQSNSHIQTWPQEKPQPWLDEPLLAKPLDTSKFTTGHFIALQREEIQLHPPEHRHKLH